MKNRAILVSSVLLLVGAGYALLFTDLPMTRGDASTYSSEEEKDELFSQAGLKSVPVKLGEFTINSSKRSGNLEMFIIEGEEKLGHKEYIPLSRAIENKWVEVKETSDVNELEISNNSDHYIYINSGDIVKGGKQDRTMQDDLIVGPGSKNESLASFCVESGRWQQRGSEDVGTFALSNCALPSKELKLAARRDKDQSKVWKEVEKEQNSINYNLSVKKGYDVNIKYENSPTSLQKALEDSVLSQDIEELKGTFQSMLKDTESEIGFAYAINGELYAIELFNNQDLLNDLWDKLLTAIVTESISNEGKDVKGNVKAMDILSPLQNDDTKIDSKKLNKETKVLQYDWNDNTKVGFKTLDRKEGDQWLHYSILSTVENYKAPHSKNERH